MRYKTGVGEEHALTVPPEAAGTRLDVFLAERLDEPSRSFIKRLIDDDLVTIDPGTPKPAYKLKGGERILLFLPEPVEMSAEPEDLPLDVVYEDASIIVLNKAAGMVVHPSPGHESGTLVNALLHHADDLSGIGGILRPGIVHRLDRDTTGCIVAAKSDAAHQDLSAQFAARRTEKTYLALTRGTPVPPEGIVEGQIGRHPKHRQLQAMLQEGGRYSLTHYRTVERFGAAALVECDIKTGRTHQIRVHLKHLHAPILCDPEYGKGESWSRDDLLAARTGNPTPGGTEPAILSRTALHAWKLAFDHPASGKRMRFEAPLPRDMADALSLLRS